MNWPGFLVQYRPDGSSNIIYMINKNAEEFIPIISKFAVSDKFIIAKAKEGWLAINRDSLQVYGCYETLDELGTKLEEKFDNLKLVEKFPRSYLFIPPYAHSVMTIISLVYILIIIGVIFLPILLRKLGKIKGVKKNKSCQVP
jgi:hypothetical protein